MTAAPVTGPAGTVVTWPPSARPPRTPARAPRPGALRPPPKWNGGDPALHERTAEDEPGARGDGDGGPVRITVRGKISPAEAQAVLRLAVAAAAEDGVAPLSEQIVLHVRHGGDTKARNL